MRTGQFTRASHSYGASLSVVKPQNNDPGSYMPAELLDPAHALSLEQQEELSQDILDLLALLKYERDY